MKKKIITRFLWGGPIGITISYLITITISIVMREGNYYPVVPQLIDYCDSEINAVVIQTLCSLLYGCICAAASVIWEIDNWSLLRMTITHLAIVSLVTFPISWFMWWMPHTLGGILSYFSIFVLIYTIIWIGQYLTIKSKIRKMNQQLKQ